MFAFVFCLCVFIVEAGNDLCKARSLWLSCIPKRRKDLFKALTYRGQTNHHVPDDPRTETKLHTVDNDFPQSPLYDVFAFHKRKKDLDICRKMPITYHIQYQVVAIIRSGGNNNNNSTCSKAIIEQHTTSRPIYIWQLSCFNFQ